MKSSSPSTWKAEHPSSRYHRIRALRYDPKLGNGEEVDISLSIDRQMIGRGTFAVVYQSYLRETRETVAVKEVVVDRTHKNRELEILLELNHPNIIKLKYSFFKEKTHVREKKVEILCLVMEMFPQTVYSLVKRWHEKLDESHVDSKQVKLFTFQMFRALTYLHARGMHRRVS
jgi:serine/threonine protein kinase